MKQNKQVYVFIQRDLGVGGIETITYNYMKYLKEKGYNVVWICDKNMYFSPTFKDVFEDGKIIIWKNRIHSPELVNLINKSKDSRITFVSFYLDGYMKAESFRKRHKQYSVDNFFFVNHYTGVMNYLETSFQGLLKNVIRKYLSSVFNIMNANGNIRYCSISHTTSMMEHYGYSISDRESLLIPPHSINCQEFDKTHCNEIYRRKEFKIVAASRFDFPHKGFFIGLINVFGQLKEKYPFLTLEIIGDGLGKQKIINEITKLPIKTQESICIVGMLSPDQFTDHLRNANLNISAAGCCAAGARVGTLSLPTRNYCMDCETYGFLSEVDKGATTCTDKGIPIEVLIEKVIHMSEDEYVKQCEADYLLYSDSANDIFNRIDLIKNKNNETLKWTKVTIVRFLFCIIMIKTRVNQRIRFVRHQGGIRKTIDYYFQKKVKGNIE